MAGPVTACPVVAWATDCPSFGDKEVSSAAIPAAETAKPTQHNRVCPSLEKPKNIVRIALSATAGKLIPFMRPRLPTVSSTSATIAGERISAELARTPH